MKKILLSLGTIAAIAAPIGVVVSCGDKTMAEKLMHEVKSEITIRKDQNIPNYFKVIEIEKAGTTLSSGDHFNGIKWIIDHDLEGNSQWKSFRKKETEGFISQKTTFTILKGFHYMADSMQIRMNISIASLKSDIKSLGKASKDITINFEDW